MKKFILISCLLFSFSLLAEDCRGTPVIRGNDLFCFMEIPEGYATLNEVEFKYGEGPLLPGYKMGLISQLRESMDMFRQKDLLRAEEIIKDVYAQNEFIISIEKKWSKRRLLEKAKPFMEDAIFHLRSFWPREGKLKGLIEKAVKNMERYSLSKKP